MIRSHRSDNRVVIIAKPNHSSSWRANKLALMALAIPSLGAALGFTALGAWPVLPFAGLELAALGSALYYVNWKLEYRQVITLSEDSVRIDKGYYAPRQTWQFDRREASLAVTPEAHPWEGPGMALHDTIDAVPVGEFLNREEALSLLSMLRKEVRVGTHSARTRLSV
ncbi:DUF2244 domain-containing protein [Chromatocurvus halotolerans]|uniref:Putative membrane protein n=1 Tax=Chromatocurvus halotolerans TaxID=1132028 RepID=A0A4R2KPK3_9GAMM|nr:DUF2244 domain-containing protein [Chromatocurvus halotolerans]TCO76141.1 putative membrane protein [Chromatocurvus halotolerans]